MRAMILPFEGKRPKIHPDAFIAQNAVIIGDVEIAADASVWYGCVLRGDVSPIRVGEGTNIQDGTVVHVNAPQKGMPDGMPCHIGANITVGHMAMLHACTLEDGAFVGMRATVMDGAVVEGGAMVAAGALVTPNKVVPTGKIWVGNPAKELRDLSDGEKEYLHFSPRHYVEEAHKYLEAQRQERASEREERQESLREQQAERRERRERLRGDQGRDR